MREQFISILALLTLVLAVFIHLGTHKIDEGHVGVYFRGGALLKVISEPGYHVMIPIITQYKLVQVTLQTDQVKKVPCGTSGGVVVHFDRIEVVNILKKNAVYDIVRNYTVDYDKPLIFDKIHHELNQLCSKNTLANVYIDKFDQIDDFLTAALQSSLEELAPGLKILSVRVTKPIIPEVIKNNYVLMESEKSKFLIAQQYQYVVEKEAETARKKAIIEAQKNAEVAKIVMDQKIQEKESQRKIQSIEDQSEFDKRKSRADSAFYETSRLATANEILLTSEYLEKLRIEAIGNLNKIYYGEKIPNIFLKDLRLSEATASNEKAN